MFAKRIAICIAVVVAVGGGPAAADEATKKIVVDFYDMAFRQHQPKKAADAYLGTTYIQHNPRVPNGPAAFSGFFEGFFAKNPTASSSVKRVLADGDLVAIHSNSKLNPQDRGRAIVDIFRVENGKIVEHWDVIQDVPETSANGNTMFDGTNAQ